MDSKQKSVGQIARLGEVLLTRRTLEMVFISVFCLYGSMSRSSFDVGHGMNIHWLGTGAGPSMQPDRQALW